MSKLQSKGAFLLAGLLIGLLSGFVYFYFFQSSSTIDKKNDADSKPKINQQVVISKKDSSDKLTSKNNKDLTREYFKQSDNESFSNINSSLDLDGSEEISLLKEELISVKNIRVKCQVINTKNKSDSFLSEVSNIYEPKGDFMMIEFWKTPLNSKGYKMSRNKLLLYGTFPDDLDVIKLDDNLYLKNSKSAFRLEYSNEFKKMESVTEKSILARLN
ncbi:MAG: hypothetical protein ACK5D5_11355 [Bacteroidota bacterium]|jgi:hypothetical protein